MTGFAASISAAFGKASGSSEQAMKNALTALAKTGQSSAATHPAPSNQSRTSRVTAGAYEIQAPRPRLWVEFPWGSRWSSTSAAKPGSAASSPRMRAKCPRSAALEVA